MYVTAAVSGVVVSGTGAPSVPVTLTNADLAELPVVDSDRDSGRYRNEQSLTWNFNSGSEAFDFLATGETLILTYTVSATDDDGTPLSDIETVSITITGTNDVPNEGTIEPGPLAYTENDTATAITGAITITDIDDTNIETRHDPDHGQLCNWRRHFGIHKCRFDQRQLESGHRHADVEAEVTA